jgi:hypothetical protein
LNGRKKREIGWSKEPCLSLSGELASVNKKLSPEPILIAGGKTGHYGLTTEITEFTKEAHQLLLILVLFVTFVVNK